MAFDPLLQRQIMGRFATGVTVVTTCCDGQLWGMTANAVMSLSLSPPLVVVSVDKSASMHGLLQKAEGFAINILKREQEALSVRFAQRGPKDFADLATKVAQTGRTDFGPMPWLMWDCQAGRKSRPAATTTCFIGEMRGRRGRQRRTADLLRRALRRVGPIRYYPKRKECCDEQKNRQKRCRVAAGTHRRAVLHNAAEGHRVRPFTGELCDNKEVGRLSLASAAAANCSTLQPSTIRGSGWPSFWQPIAAEQGRRGARHEPRAWCAPKCCAASATPTSATSSPTAPRPDRPGATA